MTTIVLLVTLALSIFMAPLAADAQRPGKVPRIGFLGDGSAASRAAQTLEPLHEGLRELGYVEGQNVILEVRWTDGHSERLSELAEEFIRLQVDVIVTHGVPGTRAAKTATTTIPIVATNVADMVRVGLVASLARPGGNVTGTSVLLPELSGKLVQLLMEMLPGITGVAVLWNRLNPGAALQAEATQTAARDVGLQVSALDVRSPDEIAGGPGNGSQRTRRRGDCGGRSVDARASHAHRAARLAREAASHLYRRKKLGGGGWAHGLRTGGSKPLQTLRGLCGQDPERRQAGGPASGATHDIRAGHQSQDRPGARPHDPPDPPLPVG
jgi:ABC transporter substrate binding protein